MGIFKKESSVNVDSTEVVTFVGREAYFQGVLTAKGSLRVDGRIEGGITDGQMVIIGEPGRIHGDISAESVVVGGHVQGNVTGTQRIEILAHGKVVGDIRTSKLMIEEGAFFEGNCTMKGISENRKKALQEDLASVKA
ncbi:MAG: polymer-forming cytoskeletal protein [Elusimicrobia bacterium]|nr:polymer-forming cytoskeletal protein [Elusimicrobiota bacterium]